MSHGFCSKFHALSSNTKILNIGYDLTKLQGVQRWEIFLRHSVDESTAVYYLMTTSRLLSWCSLCLCLQEVENGRLFKLLCKLGAINDRPE